MKLNVYENGQFFQWSEEERVNNGFSEQKDDEEFEEYLVNRGISSQSPISIGNEFGRLVQIYQGSGKYLAYVQFTSEFTEILIIGIGSLLMFLKEYESIFENKKCDYIETNDSGRFLRKDNIYELRIIGTYKKGELCELLAYDKEGNSPDVLLRSSRDFIEKRLHEDFGLIV